MSEENCAEHDLKGLDEGEDAMPVSGGGVGGGQAGTADVQETNFLIQN